MKAVLFAFSQYEILAHQLKGGFQLFSPQGGLQKEMQRECNDWNILAIYCRSFRKQLFCEHVIAFAKGLLGDREDKRECQ
jgi:hypothetical protein